MKTTHNQQKQPYNLRYNDSLSVTQNDIQYELWSNLIKKTSDALIQKQLRIMAESTKLIDTYNEEIFKQKQEESIKTRDQTQGLLSGYFNFDKESSNKFKRESMFKMSLSNDNVLMISRSANHRNQFNSPNERVICRRSPLANHQSFNFVFSKQLKDIEQNCRPKTFKSIKLLVDDLKKLKKYFTQYQANEKRMMRNLQMLEKEHEDYLILKKINEENEKRLEQVRRELQENKSKIRKLISQRQATNQGKTFEFLGLKEANVNNLTNFLESKEKNIINKLNQVIEVEKSTLNIIQTALSTKLQENTQELCQKCCDFFKKAKTSLLKMRQSMLEQSEQMEKLYTNYRGLMIEDISRMCKKYGKGPRSIKSLSIKSDNPKARTFLKLENPQSQAA